MSILAGIALKFAEPIIETIGSVIKRILPPEKMSEAEAARLKQELTLEMLKMDWSSLEAEVKDRIDARILAAKELEKGNAFTNVLAALHRPTWSFVMLGIFVLTIVDQWLGLPPLDLTPEQTDVMRTVVIFYFGGRTAEKGILSWSNGNGRGKETKETTLDALAEKIVEKKNKMGPRR